MLKGMFNRAICGWLVALVLLVGCGMPATAQGATAALKVSDLITQGPHVDLRAFGADPSKSSAVNTAAIQSAINYAAAQKKQLRFPFRDQVYLVNAKLTLPSNVEIDFNGCTIKRDTTAGVFDMIENADTVGGNTRIRVSNLIIDGNKDADGRVATNVADRFRGLGLFNVTDSEFRNLTVTRTVNGEAQPEGRRAGVYLEGCSDITFENFTGTYNDRTAFYPYQSDHITVKGAYVAYNKGSGLGSEDADFQDWSDVRATQNGYSQVSLNGIRGKLTNIFAWNGDGSDPGTYAGVNIGHNSDGARAHYTVATNIHVWDNPELGLNVAGSSDVVIHGLYSENNGDRNVRIHTGSNRVIIDGLVSRWCASTGVIYYAGTGHQLNNAVVSKNGSGGIFADGAGTELTLGSNIRSFDNGQVSLANSSGLTANGARVTVNGGEFFNSTGTITAITQANPAVVTSAGHGRESGEKVILATTGMTEVNGNTYTITVIDANTFSLDGVDSTAYGAFVSGSWESSQESGIWTAGGFQSLRRPYVRGKTYSIRETSSPTFLERFGVRLSRSVAMTGSFTAANNTATTVNNANATSISRIAVWPGNPSAVTKGIPYVSSVVPGVSFTITFPTAATGTEVYYYEIK